MKPPPKPAPKPPLQAGVGSRLGQAAAKPPLQAGVGSRLGQGCVGQQSRYPPLLWGAHYRGGLARRLRSPRRQRG